MTILRAALVTLPKVELHCHIERTMRPGTLVDLARGNSVPLPTSDPTELYRFDSLDDFLEVFWVGQSTLVSREDWSRLAYEAVVDGARDGVVYRESFFTPARHLAAGQSLGDIVAGLDEGLSAGEAETGAGCRLIADMDLPSRPAWRCSGPSGSTTACRSSTMRSWSLAWPRKGSPSRSALPRTS